MGTKFSVPVQTGPGAHPTSYTTGTGSLPGVKRPVRDVDHPPTSSAEVKERLELYQLLGLRGLFWGEVCLRIIIIIIIITTNNYLTVYLRILFTT